jgi:hypothetical protein
MNRNRLGSEFYLRLFPIGTRFSTYRKEVGRNHFERSRRPRFSPKREIRQASWDSILLQARVC